MRLHPQLVLPGELAPDFFDLLRITHHQPEMLHAIRLQLLDFKNRHELMFAQFAPGRAFSTAQHLESEHV